MSSFELLQRVGKAFASSSLVPKEYVNNVANCMIALSIADRIKADPLMVMQNLVMIHGRPSWSAKFLIGTANACGRFTAIRYEFFGTEGTDGWGCRAVANEKLTGEELRGSDITIKMAKLEGWYDKNGSKWKTMPKQMLMYRSGSFWVSAYAPEISLGLPTSEEVIDATQGADGTYRVDLSEAATQLGLTAPPQEPEPEQELEDDHEPGANG